MSHRPQMPILVIVLLAIVGSSSFVSAKELPSNWKRKAVDGNLLEIEKEKGEFEESARRFLKPQER